MHQKLGATPEGRALLGVIDAVGGPGELSKLLGVRRQTIDNWAYISKRVSKEGAIAIESALDGITKEQLRPDIANWDSPMSEKDLLAELAKTARGRGFLLILGRVKSSRKALASILGLSSPHVVQNWIRRGYLPKRHVKPLLAMPEFAGLTAEMVRPDLHEADY